MSKKLNKHNILVQNPYPSSYAGLIKLNQYLFKQSCHSPFSIRTYMAQKQETIRQQHCKKVHKHIVFVKNPHLKSYASLVQLNKELFKQTWDYPKTWDKMRKKFLWEFKNKHGTIKCYYCDKTDLKMKTKCKRRLATIDHVIPRTVTKKKYDPNNFKIACYDCNKEKNTMSEWQFRKHLFIKAIKNNKKIKNIIKLFGKCCLCSLKLSLTLM